MNEFGSNLGYVDELYARYSEDPNSVSEAWREFFADYRPQTAKTGAPSVPPVADEPDAVPLEGAAARVAENMTRSLSVPTATSARTIPVKLLYENRRLINRHLDAVSGSKISFTHLIAWAIVRAVERHPSMNFRFVDRDGRPHRGERKGLNLGIAIDFVRRGERLLLVPNIKNAETLDFAPFVSAYSDLLARARSGKLDVQDFRDTTVTLTNPGTVGTVMSVPRLMQGQGTIIGTGVIGYPAEYAGMAPEVISELGLSKVMTITSTYDHRVIQGAESGAFLATIEKLLLGEDGFYDRIFRELRVPHEPVRFSADQNPQVFRGAGSTEAIAKQAGVHQLIRAYRVRGHLLADLDPLGYEPERHPELDLSHYGLTAWDLDRKFVAGGLAGETGVIPLRKIVDILRQTYCGHIGVEFMHIQQPEIRHWLQERMERPRNSEPLSREQQARILAKLNAAEAFEKFLHGNYVGHKRFSLEGAETLVPMLDALLEAAGDAGAEDVLVGMAHRGRLNVVANIIGKSYGTIFRQFQGDVDPENPHGSGDVKYHLGATGSHETASGRSLRVRVATNPSHLEAVNPVVEGMVRARQDRVADLERRRIVPVLIHGDAAFAGQGVVAETLNLSQLKGYRTGGTVHIVVNNQIGFTTGPADARSSPYATDVAKAVQAPIFHVNGDHPEDAVRVVRLAFAFRQEFQKDVVVDLLCYRRWGHNEADDPSFTHPILYGRIEEHRSTRKLYTEQLLRRGEISPEQAEHALEDFRSTLETALAEVRAARETDSGPLRSDVEAVEGVARPHVATGVPRETLERIVPGLDRVPEGFRIHPKLARQLARRSRRFASGTIDWSLAEALAFGSLVLDGTPVRLSGEDSGRGTFSQRHAILYNQNTGEPYVPLAHLSDGQAPFVALDSLLSEYAVLGFEYGFSVEDSKALVLWEAQFGDFANGAQVVIDQFVASAEDKWGQRSGLVMLLPHGYEGQGPDHSNARLERFLQLAGRGNIQVVNATTPAQYFHVLRRQVRRDEIKPLVVLTPKSLLRHPAAVSSPDALTSGEFEEVLDDPSVPDPAEVRRVVFCSGKIYYEAAAHRESEGARGVAFVRIEQLYPFPATRLEATLAVYPNAEEIVWLQEEPRNMGAFRFIDDRFRPLLAGGRSIAYVGRARSASPATGAYHRHTAEQAAILADVLHGLPRSARPVTTPDPGRG